VVVLVVLVLMLERQVVLVLERQVFRRRHAPI